MANGLLSCIHPSRRCCGSPIDEVMLQLHLGGEYGQNSTAEVELRDRRHQEARLRALGSTFCPDREAFLLRNGYPFICFEARLPRVQYVTVAFSTRCEYVEVAQGLRSSRSSKPALYQVSGPHVQGRHLIFSASRAESKDATPSN